MSPRKKALEKKTIVKGENAGNKHIVLFPQCLLLLSNREIIITATFNSLHAKALKFAPVQNFVKNTATRTGKLPQHSILAKKLGSIAGLG